MPFETRRAAPKRIAVIGGGISGLGAAHLLADSHRVVLFEAENRLGGHARTVLAGRRGDQPVDTGFIVFNHVNYPHLTRLFDELGVPPPRRLAGSGSVPFGIRSRSVFRFAADPPFGRPVRHLTLAAGEWSSQDLTALGRPASWKKLLGLINPQTAGRMLPTSGLLF